MTTERVTITGFRNAGSFDGKFASNYALEPSQAGGPELAAGIYRFDNSNTGASTKYNVFAMGNLIEVLATVNASLELIQAKTDPTWAEIS
ncbi:hypothetical protein [Acidisphaera sp. L21]|uniref:hypothetical protein n=1 Tax=Acidisphaera sp. L21 TaxID=1641851 RepID=UPI00131D6975|nr:hypothetical protein [Acidisphaera sp. L21]